MNDLPRRLPLQGSLVNRRALLVRGLAAASLIALGACGGSPAGQSGAASAEQPKTTFNIGWSIYAGFMPWSYAQKAGIVKKWADKYGLTINLVQVNDYVESINQYTAGKLDGVACTTMDALTIPAAGGKDTTVLIIGDYSNGNDGLVLKNGRSVADVRGRTVHLVELSVSHYLLARALETAGVKLSEVKTVNTGDADIAGAFASPEVTAVAAWNPQLSEVRRAPGATMVFDSSMIPNEILDSMNVSTATLKANPNLGKALTGIWYETMALMSGAGADATKARAMMAADAGTTPADFESQLATTFLYSDPKAAAAYAVNPDLVTVTDRVRQFSFSQGLFGPSASSVDAIGIAFPGDKTLGDQANVKLRFDSTFMQMAAENKL